MTLKHDILLAIGQLGTARDAAALVTLVGTGAHDITHLLWRLQKQGLIRFRTNRNGARREYPTNIELTEKGRQRL